MESDSTLARFYSRKFWLAVLVVLLSSLLVWFGKIDPGVYSSVTIAAVGGYLAANVIQKHVIGEPE